MKIVLAEAIKFNNLDEQIKQLLVKIKKAFEMSPWAQTGDLSMWLYRFSQMRKKDPQKAYEWAAKYLQTELSKVAEASISKKQAKYHKDLIAKVQGVNSRRKQDQTAPTKRKRKTAKAQAQWPDDKLPMSKFFDELSGLDTDQILDRLGSKLNIKDGSSEDILWSNLVKRAPLFDSSPGLKKELIAQLIQVTGGKQKPIDVLRTLTAYIRPQRNNDMKIIATSTRQPPGMKRALETLKRISTKPKVNGGRGVQVVRKPGAVKHAGAKKTLKEALDSGIPARHIRGGGRLVRSSEEQSSLATKFNIPFKPKPSATPKPKPKFNISEKYLRKSATESTDSALANYDGKWVTVPRVSDTAVPVQKVGNQATDKKQAAQMHSQKLKARRQATKSESSDIALAAPGHYSKAQKISATKLLASKAAIRKPIATKMLKKQNILKKILPDRKKYRALRIAGAPVPKGLRARLQVALEQIQKLNAETAPARAKIKSINFRLKELKRAAGFKKPIRKKIIRKKFKPMKDVFVAGPKK